MARSDVERWYAGGRATAETTVKEARAKVRSLAKEIMMGEGEGGKEREGGRLGMGRGWSLVVQSGTMAMRAQAPSRPQNTSFLLNMSIQGTRDPLMDSLSGREGKRRSSPVPVSAVR